MARRQFESFDPHLIEAVARVLGSTEAGLTGSEIGIVLGQSEIEDVDGPQQTKWLRIYNALASRQNSDGAGNCVIRFITEAMTPVRYRQDPAALSWRIDHLNEVLVHAGYLVRDDGKLRRSPEGRATTLDEAQRRVGTIRSELNRRRVHETVLAYCTLEILQKNNFHAVLEAAKSISDRLRSEAGLQLDGSDLVDATLSRKSGPIVSINAGISESDHSEQNGFANLLKGLHGMYRNPTAHSPRISRHVTDDELLEAFTTFSMVHRRLDSAVVRPAPR